MTYDRGDLLVRWCLLEVHGLDASDPLAIVLDFGPWLHQCVEHNVAIVVDDGNPC